MQTKPPVNPHDGRLAKISDPTMWGSFAEAVACAYRDQLPGVGFVLTKTDGLMGLDLDKCVDAETGEVEPWAQEIVDLAETYAEISPSGRGIRLWVRGKIDATVKCVPAHVEMYRSARFLAVTGRHIETTPDAINAAPRTLAALRQRVADWASQREPPREPITAASSYVAPDRPSGDFFENVRQAALANIGMWVNHVLPTARRSASGT